MLLCGGYFAGLVRMSHDIIQKRTRLQLKTSEFILTDGKNCPLLSTHANRQGMDISITICVFFFVCTITDFSAEDNASGIKFCTAVHCVQGKESPIMGNFALPETHNWPANRPPRALNYKYNILFIVT